MSLRIHQTKSCWSLVLLAICSLCGSTPELQAQQRTWNDSSGTFSVDAELIEEKNGTVTLRRKDGTDVALSFSKLSAADQNYIRQQKEPETTVSPTIDEATPPSGASAGSSDGKEEGEPENFADQYWQGFQNAFRVRVWEGSDSEEVKERIAGLRAAASIMPESTKSRFTMPIMVGVALLLSPFVLIWTLLAEFRENLLWGIAQVTSLVVGFCFLPLMIPVITLIFVLANLKERWLLGLANLVVIVLAVGSFLMVPLEIYDGIELTPPESEAEATPDSK